MSIHEIVHRVPCIHTLAKFYVDHLAMSHESDGDDVLVGYSEQTIRIRLTKAHGTAAYTHDRYDRYWKIGITLPNVDIAYKQLKAAGINVSQPHQFRDIGYLCHVTDPGGFIVELLQHDFQQNRRSNVGDHSLPLGGGAKIGQVTLRITDVEPALHWWQDTLGMKLLSVQPVEDLQFTLYFLAATEDDPPCEDLTDVNNREWLWRRPYPTIELQHCWAENVRLNPPIFDAAGFSHLVLSSNGSAVRYPPAGNG